eukprot:3208894-Alexandrium_andersonii.AAC.1
MNCGVAACPCSRTPLQSCSRARVCPSPLPFRSGRYHEKTFSGKLVVWWAWWAVATCCCLPGSAFGFGDESMDV